LAMAGSGGGGAALFCKAAAKLLAASRTVGGPNPYSGEWAFNDPEPKQNNIPDQPTHLLVLLPLAFTTFELPPEWHMFNHHQRVIKDH